MTELLGKFIFFLSSTLFYRRDASLLLRSSILRTVDNILAAVRAQRKTRAFQSRISSWSRSAPTRAQRRTGAFQTQVSGLGYPAAARAQRKMRAFWGYSAPARAYRKTSAFHFRISGKSGPAAARISRRTRALMVLASCSCCSGGHYSSAEWTEFTRFANWRFMKIGAATIAATATGKLPFPTRGHAHSARYIQAGWDEDL